MDTERRDRNAGALLALAIIVVVCSIAFYLSSGCVSFNTFNYYRQQPTQSTTQPTQIETTEQNIQIPTSVVTDTVNWIIGVFKK